MARIVRARCGRRRARGPRCCSPTTVTTSPSLERDAAAPAADRAKTRGTSGSAAASTSSGSPTSSSRATARSSTPSCPRRGVDRGAGGLRDQPRCSTSPRRSAGPSGPGTREFEVLTGRRPVVELAVGAPRRARRRDVEVRRGVTVEGLLTGTARHPGTARTSSASRTTDGDVPRGPRRRPHGTSLRAATAPGRGRGPPADRGARGLRVHVLRAPLPVRRTAPCRSPSAALQHCRDDLVADARRRTTAPGASRSSPAPPDKALLGLRDLDRWEQVVRSLAARRALARRRAHRRRA